MVHQVWESTVDGRLHRVESRGDVVRTHVWTVDGEQVAEKKTMDDKATLKAGTAAYDGSLLVRFTALGRPRRATVLPHEGLGELGIGGTDLAPEPGSAAARYEEKVLAHPTRHTIIATLGGLATVVDEPPGAVIAGCSCPLAAVVDGHPATCLMAEALLGDVIGAPVRQACEPEIPRCRFVIEPGPVLR